MADFVNPYTFVPLAQRIDRREPVSHASMAGDRLCGALKITLTAKTPLLIGGFEQKDGGQKSPDVPRRANGTPMIPGSGLMGAVRSVHEALAGGCMRVLDTEWVPVHRHPAHIAQTRGLRLGVVLDVDGEGRPVSIGLCDDEVWLDHRILPGGGQSLPSTGDRLTVPVHKAVDSPGRKVLRPQDVAPGDVRRLAQMGASLDDSWVLLATDTHARGAGKPVYFAAGRVGPGTPRLTVPDTTWDTYRQVVDGADDLRTARLPDGGEPEWGSVPPEHEEVYRPLAPDGRSVGPEVAQRLLARRYLHLGQPVWVRAEGREVTEIRLSRLWRYPGRYPVGERAGESGPCTDPDHLCWSCRVFGSADTSGRGEDDIARQRSYRGHVRVDDLLVEGSFEPDPWWLAPLEAPRPSAGQFYLDNTAVPAGKKKALKDAPPAATWGSCADDGRPRPLRGRKFYWRTAGPDQEPHPRGRRRHQGDTQTRDVVLIPAGTVFTGRVCFENLSAEEYGSLLAALDPRLLAEAGRAEWHGAVTSVGGGKPFGFGAVSIGVTVEWVHTAAGRYLGQHDKVPSPGDAVSAFCVQVPHAVSAVWPALRNVLHLGFIPDDLVWYPPGTGRKGDPEFDRSFEFFARSNGLTFNDKERDLVTLPPAVDPADRQVLDSAGGERALTRDADSGSDRGRGRGTTGRAGRGRP
jgi:CRISPR/Cas system CSM-associated protein Csm3 (group 7 of RAMP superfamily)